MSNLLWAATLVALILYLIWQRLVILSQREELMYLREAWEFPEPFPRDLPPTYSTSTDLPQPTQNSLRTNALSSEECARLSAQACQNPFGTLQSEFSRSASQATMSPMNGLTVTPVTISKR